MKDCLSNIAEVIGRVRKYGKCTLLIQLTIRRLNGERGQETVGDYSVLGFAKHDQEKGKRIIIRLFGSLF